MVAPLVLGGIGAGVGLLGSLFGNKSQQQFQYDPDLRAYMEQVRGLGMTAYQSDPSFLTAMRALQGLAGNDQGMVNQAMNPYMAAMNPYFDMLRKQAVTGANQEATQAGAFGGTGSQTSAAIAGNLSDMQRSQFNYQGFNDAMQRLAQTASLGMAMPNARMGLLTPGMTSAGSTRTMTSPSNPFQAMAGGFMGGMSFGSPRAPGGFSYPNPNQGFGPATPGQVW